MSCCGISVAAQRQVTATRQGLTSISYATADPTEPGVFWRADWAKCKVVFDGQRTDQATVLRASREGWADFYMFDLGSGQIGEQDGAPITKRLQGDVQIFVPTDYSLSIILRNQKATGAWWR